MMQFQYIPYIWPLMSSSFVSLSLGIFALLRRRNAKGALSFILSMFVVTIWSFGNALEMSAIDFSTKLFWANIQYIAYCYSPVTLLALCMEFTGHDKWIKNRKILWFAMIPTIVIILVWTDGLHGLIRYDMKLDYSGLFPVIVKKYGRIFYIHAAYSHFLNLMAWVLLVRAVFFTNTVYRKQAMALFFGLSLIVIPNMMYILHISPIKRFDITPVFFGPAGLIIAWGIFRFKLFDLVPLARATVIESMDAGVMVLDLQERILDINPAFERILGMSVSQISTRRVDKVCRDIPKLAIACMDRSITQAEFTINTGDGLKIYEVLLSPLMDNKNILLGRLAVTYDITKKKQEEELYYKQQWERAITVEKERHARDMHDNLGQILGFISFQAQGIRQELISSGVEIVSDKLDKLVDVAQSANNEIREYIRNVRSVETTRTDFITALRQDVLRFEELTDVRVKLVIPDNFAGVELKPNICINLLYILKEALNNIRKHAKATQVNIMFTLTQNQLDVVIEDNGVGFDINQQYYSTKSKFGLCIIGERAAEIGAKAEIFSSKGKGSRITFCVSIREEEKTSENESAVS